MFILPLQFLANLSIEGTYQGKNLYVQNPENGDGFGFCAYKVTINDSIELHPDSLKTAAFQINLMSYGFNIGDSLFIVIFHHDGCKPKILNPYPHVIPNKITFGPINIDASGVLTWSTLKNEFKTDFIVQTYRWNKWIDIGTVAKSKDSAEYSYAFVPHSGENTLRLKYGYESYNTKTTKEIKWLSPSREIKIVKIDPELRQILLSDSSLYELFDAYGNIIKKGFAKGIDCSSYRSDKYYLNFDNRTQAINFSKPKRKKR